MIGRGRQHLIMAVNVPSGMKNTSKYLHIIVVFYDAIKIMRCIHHMIGLNLWDETRFLKCDIMENLIVFNLNFNTFITLQGVATQQHISNTLQVMKKS